MNFIKQSVVNILLILLCMIASRPMNAQSLYDLNTIQKIEISFSQPDWDYQMDTAKDGDGEYLMASSVTINGISFDSTGVKYKGNSSYDSTKLKNPFHISLNEFKNQKYKGYTDIKLSNSYGDPSLIREVLAYDILKNYMHCPLSNFAQLYINGNYIGLYSSAETIDKNFCADHFYSSQNAFIKCNPTISPGPTTKSNFKYINADSNSYDLFYEIKSDYGWNDLVNLCDSITNNTSSLDHVLDMDRIMWMLAFNNVLINLDSYSGVFAQNHYTYLDNTGHFNPIIWDLNMAFGAFPFAGLGGTSMGNLNAIQMQQFSTANHASDTNWPLINAIQANPSWKKKYIAHMRTMLNEQFINHNYLTTANQLRGMIDTAVDSDNNKFFTYLQFQQSMDSSVDVGSYDVPGIKTLMAARSTYLQSTPEFSALPPVISAIASNPASPAIHTNTNISLTVTNATPSSVMIGYRFDKTQKFIKAIMFDDGMHNDGAANDNQYGLSINMLGGTMQYYFYAENNDAGLFAPERAEHEYYTLHATSQIPVTGQLVINELLADNVTHEQDEYGNTEDWIEIYNNSTSLLDLSNLYLSDDLNNLMKWKFPSNTSLPPNEYLMIWADDDSSQQIYHTNFQLNKDSAILILTNSTSLILDSISFKAQNTNISYGRYPNGTGNFIPMNTTFGSINNNYPLLLNQHSKQNSFLIYPNPSSESVHLVFHGEQNIQIFTVQGRLIYAGKANGHATIYTDQWDNGIYFVKCDHQIQKMIIHHP